MIKVAVVDDDQLVAVSLKTILEADEIVKVSATGRDGKEAIEIYKREKPDILLMDIRMEGVNGLEAAEQILNWDPQAKILFLTTFLDDEYIIKALNIGARGYILKQDFEGIVPAVKAVSGGQSVYGGDIMGKIPGIFKRGEINFGYKEAGITEKEKLIIEQVGLGLSNREIAEKLFFSEGTVRNYVSAILEKLELRDRTQLAVFFWKNKQR